MQTYEILVHSRAIVPNSKDMSLVRTSVGVDTLHVLFDDEEWLGFPVKVTFAQGSEKVTQQLVLSEVTNSQWVAEASCVIPHEVIRSVGRIRVTLQGTDSDGNHIITARGAPLSVEEAGDVVDGSMPEDAPTMSDWEAAYADAMRAVADAASLVSDLRSRLDDIVADARAEIESMTEDRPIATTTDLGMVVVGDNLSVTEAGVLSADSGLSNVQESLLDTLAGMVEDGVVKPDALPIADMDHLGAVYPDGVTVLVDDDGMMHVEQAYVPTATTLIAGIVRPDGTTITVDADGTIHGSSQVDVATTSAAGIVRPDGETITVDADGTIHGSSQIDVATTAVAGIVKPDGETITVDADGTIHGQIAEDPMSDEDIEFLTPYGDLIPDGDEVLY